MALPSKPSLLAPLGNQADARTFRFSCYTAGLPFLAWGLQVGDRADLTGTLYWNPHDQTTNMTPQSVNVPYAGYTLPIGPSLYWRARGRNADGWGPWSASGYFRAHPNPGGTRDPYAEWAGAILADMARPRVALIPGTIFPHGAAVAPLVTSDMGSRWRLSLPDQSPPVLADLAVVGMTVELSADTGWSVTAVTGHAAGQGRSGDYLARVLELNVYHHWRLSDPVAAVREAVVGWAGLYPGGAGAKYFATTPWGETYPDEPDGCLYLDGTATAYLEGGDILEWTGKTPFSYAAWVRLDTRSRRERVSDRVQGTPRRGARGVCAMGCK